MESIKKKKGWSGVKDILTASRTSKFFSNNKVAKVFQLKNVIAKRKLQQLVNIRRELLMSSQNNRQIPLQDNLTLKFINQRPEIRFRVYRRSARKNLRAKIRQEVLLKRERLNELKLADKQEFSKKNTSMKNVLQNSFSDVSSFEGED